MFDETRDSRNNMSRRSKGVKPFAGQSSRCSALVIAGFGISYNQYGMFPMTENNPLPPNTTASNRLNRIKAVQAVTYESATPAYRLPRRSGIARTQRAHQITFATVETGPVCLLLWAGLGKVCLCRKHSLS